MGRRLKLGAQVVGVARTRVVRLVLALAAMCGGVLTVAAALSPPAAAALFAGDGVVGYGDAQTPGTFAGMTVDSPLVAIAGAGTDSSYWVTAADGGVFAFGGAPFLGSMGGHPLDAPVIAIASPNPGGYWLAAMDGGVFAFGDAPFLGSMGGHPLAQPIVGMASTPDGKGYWLVAADGGVFAFGDAAFYGSMGGQALDAPVSGMAATPDGKGYWLVGSDGGVFAFGDAQYFGGAADQNIGTWVTGIARTVDGQGYWLVAATAGVLPYGDAAFDGPSPNDPPFSPTVGMAATPDGKGYWLLQPDDVATSFTVAGQSVTGTARSIVSLAASQVGPDPDASQGSYCNPYGPCENWCSLFLTWVWESAGIDIPRYPFTGSIYDWGAANHHLVSTAGQIPPGDALMFGTGPQNAATSVHTGIVAESWPDGAVVTIEGDSGPEPDGQFAVTMDGPYLVSDAGFLLGMPVYGAVSP